VSSTAEALHEQIVEAWRTNQRIHLFLIEKISDEGMLCTLSTRGGRNVVRQFAHLNNVRFWHLERRAPDLAAGLRKFATAEEPEKPVLVEALEASAERIERFLLEALDGAPRRRVFKRGVIQTLGYLISHESHHRGSILLTLKQSGHKLDQASSYGIWDWDRI
jgi:uncharacterized damage-inducible protein DinB